MPRRRTPWISLAVIASCTLTSVLLIHEWWLQRAGKLPPAGLDALRLVHHQIVEDYVFERDPEELIYLAIEGMVEKGLDTYSKFVPPERVRAFEGQEITGTVDDIGVELVPKRMPVTVQWSHPGSPAERAGLRTGDELLAADAEPLELADAVERLSGVAGTSVALRVRRAGALLDVSVEREAVHLPTVRWVRILDEARGIGYLHIAEFQRGMALAFDAAVEALQRERGAPLGGLVVDVRENGGGLLDEAIALANRFLRQGTIVSLRHRDGSTSELHEAVPEHCTLPDLPVVILVDRRSASATEVFAAALQDHGRARLVGERTFGKGLVQQIYTWSHRPFRLKMSSAHYYTPHGRNIAKSLRRADDGDDPGGIDPDRPIAQTVQEVNERARVLDTLEPPAAQREAVEALAAELGFQPARPPGLDDPCIATALEELEPAPR